MSVDWTDERKIAQLRTLWAEGHSSFEIARRMVTTKNAVVGKAHRLGLASRPSPIRRGEKVKPAKLNVVESQRAVKAAIAAPPKPPAPEPVKITLKSLPCCWPIGMPRTPSFHFCDAPSVPGKPYCEPHVAVAYVPVSVRSLREAI